MTNSVNFDDPLVRSLIDRNHLPMERMNNNPGAFGPNATFIVCKTDQELWPCTTRQGLEAAQQRQRAARQVQEQQRKEAAQEAAQRISDKVVDLASTMFSEWLESDEVTELLISHLRGVKVPLGRINMDMCQCTYVWPPASSHTAHIQHELAKAFVAGIKDKES